MRDTLIKANDKQPMFIRGISKEENDYIDQVIRVFNVSNKDDKYKLKLEFNARFGIELETVELYGNKSHVDTNMLKKVFEPKIITFRLGEDKTNDVTAYPCFSGDEIRYTNEQRMVFHEDKMSSWTCLMDRFEKYQYLLIYEITKKDVKK